MNVAVDSQWNRENSNFVMDNNDYEKAFENYISDDNGEYSFIFKCCILFIVKDCFGELLSY